MRIPVCFNTLWALCFLLLLLLLVHSQCTLFGGSGLRRAKGYTVSFPRNWSVQERSESDFAHRTGDGNLVTLTTSCERDAKTPLELLTKHLLIGTRDITVLRRERIPVEEREGLLSSVKATLNGVAVFMELFVVADKDCIFDFTLLGKAAFPEKELNEFLNLVKSLKFEGHGP